MKVWIPHWHKALYNWLVKPWQVSSPLKLKKTSKFLYWWVKEDDEAPLLVIRAIGDWGYSWEDLKGEIKLWCGYWYNITKENEWQIWKRGWKQARGAFRINAFYITYCVTSNSLNISSIILIQKIIEYSGGTINSTPSTQMISKSHHKIIIGDSHLCERKE